MIYGCYEIISRTNRRSKDGHILYNCRCIHCGTEKQMQLSAIKYRNNDSCTHFLKIGGVSISNDIDSKSIPNKRMRHIFLGMIRRCYDIYDKDYHNYGAKGIDISSEWLDSPSKFYEWSILNGYKNNLSIDRIDENKGYYPENCRWITFTDNVRFKSNTNYITAKVTLSGNQWASLIPEHGKNFINKMIREKGKEKTIEYLEDRLKDKHTSSTE